MTEPIVSIVSENARFRRSVRELAESAGLQAATFPTLQALLDGTLPESRGCVLFYPEHNTLDDPGQQARLAAACAGRGGILIIERGNIPMAVQALKGGITDVLETPYRDRELLERIEKLLEGKVLS